ncbi:uncharacterized protein MONBRDRAFT_34091 [Monosiga brevicollis MX1]|uniref:Uncharacterized protein n=1 Tax=Monosiga brevicollis TaxID=81824 RepID=A9V9E4_MONBE|nr:uncharacterized protein MONBRDRAFT_34091 [Monosiga brevicollis MX1]EDQ85846.1 predicted protein [Monosiga brevicollis MX1]|eukprot:XP_001749325.1 hypothetical protein [Monosiga brevicollis MX1]
MAPAARLASLRALLKQHAVSAFIIPSEDPHQSEYIADCYARRAWISGFDGSAGEAIVTASKAALWTDGRYWLQASNQLDEAWTLMKSGQPDVPSRERWLSQVIPSGEAVGVDPAVTAHPDYQNLKTALDKKHIRLVPLQENLIDAIWQDRPRQPQEPIRIQPLQAAGQPVEAKLEQLRADIRDADCSCIIVTALDDIAWLFNLRGNDIQYNPVFYAYALVTMDQAWLFVDDSRFDPGVREQLSAAVEVLPYESFFSRLPGILNADPALKNLPIFLARRCSHAVVDILETAGYETNLDITPVESRKAVKNPVELAGMRACHIRDAVALSSFFMTLDKLFEVKQQLLYHSLSFDTISSIGANGSIIHYTPNPVTCDRLDNKRVYLCDSGGQYTCGLNSRCDGTTDITRTVHFGTPTAEEKMAFTRVLKGHIALSNLRFPPGTNGRTIDPFARASLWEAGMDYAHGTGHGVGSHLNVHEGPMQISFRPKASEHPLEPGQVVTIEPGYYKDGAFGIRIENVVEVVSLAPGDKSLGFSPITLFPIQRKMLDVKLLTATELDWLNRYHTTVRARVGPELMRQGKTEELHWLQQQTEPIAA